jgi:CheY-like chemotaxis protein/HPt (histidine-containing phosphotransfer) domain-containing protein
VIDDNPVNLKVALAMLGNLGLQATAADNGRAGLALCAQGGIDLVLMDCQMPELDGFGTTKLLRHAEATRGNGFSVPIIALTANAMAGDRQLCLEAGMNDYLTKPIRREALLAMLGRWLPVRKSQVVDLTPTTSVGSELGGEPDLDGQVVQQLLADLGDPNGAILPELLANFRSQTTVLHEKLQAAAEVGDHLQVARAAHNLKGQAMTFGFARFAALAKDLERAAKAGDTLTCQRRSRELPIIQASAEQALTRWSAR